jgi:CheY-like chemotaxis protein
MDGYEATQLIRRWEVDKCEQCRALEKIEYEYMELKECAHHRIPIVAVTADVMKGTHEMCFSAGMDDYIPKVIVLPFLVTLLCTQTSFISLPRHMCSYHLCLEYSSIPVQCFHLGIFFKNIPRLILQEVT